jgi:hypothetical protein
LATDDHLIWIIGVGWVYAGDLKSLAGYARLLDASGQPVLLVSHHLLTYSEDVFNLSVWSNESFFVWQGRYWVHGYTDEEAEKVISCATRRDIIDDQSRMDKWIIRHFININALEYCVKIARLEIVLHFKVKGGQ